MILKTATFSLNGEVSEHVSTADSASVMRRRFCPKCGTPLFSEASDRPDLMVVRVGALDDSQASQPTAVIWTASAPGWAVLDPDLPSHKGQPGAVPKG